MSTGSNRHPRTSLHERQSQTENVLAFCFKDFYGFFLEQSIYKVEIETDGYNRLFHAHRRIDRHRCASTSWTQNSEMCGSINFNFLKK